MSGPWSSVTNKTTFCRAANAGHNVRPVAGKQQQKTRHIVISTLVAKTSNVAAIEISAKRSRLTGDVPTGSKRIGISIRSTDAKNWPRR